MKFDPERVADARYRALKLVGEAEYHESQARAARARAEQLAKAWGFDAGSLLDKPPPGA